MDPTVYIPNLNGADRLHRALASLAAQTVRCRIAVVDNASTDGSVKMIRQGFPDVEIIQMDRNRGFGVPLNRAIREVPGDPLILVNNDIECDPRFVEEMLAAAADGAEMVAGVLVQHDRPELIDTAGIVAEARTLMAFDYLRGERVDGVDSAAAPFGPSGGAALYKREAFEQAGGFDERIFLYYEDLDLALRMTVNGGRCALAGGARASHVGSATLGDRPARKYAFTGWSRGYMLRRYGVMRTPGGAARALASEAAICAGQLLIDHTTRGISGRVRGWRAGAGLERHSLPANGLLTMSVAESLGRRARGRA